MSKICPKCGSELPQSATVCVSCGANANATPDIDNSDAINRMLSSGEESVVVQTAELNKEQEAAFNSGKAVEFSPITADTTGIVELSEDADVSEAIMAMDSMKFDGILPLDAGDEPEDNTEPIDPENIVIKKGVTEIKRFRIPRRVKKAILICFLFVITFAAGFVLHFSITRGVFDNYANEAGYSSLRLITPRVPEGYNFTPFEIYVKRGVDVTECIVFGVHYTSVNEFAPTYYRILINNHDRTDSQFIRPFNQDEYEELVNSSDANERLRAAHMMGLYENFRRSVNEINSGSSGWVEANLSVINSRLRNS
jgi:hypothetical protein